MQTFLRIAHCLVSLLLIVSACRAETPDSRVRAALALSAASKATTGAKAGAASPGCGCSCAERGCNCAYPGECGDPGCCCAAALQAKGNTLSTSALERGIETAIRHKTHLVLWVGEACLPCERKMKEYTHCRLTEYDSGKGVETGPEVIVCRREGKDFYIVARIAGIPDDLAEQVRNVISPLALVVKYLPQPPIPMMMPMMPMGGFGGFGGGFGGGC